MSTRNSSTSASLQFVKACNASDVFLSVMPYTLERHNIVRYRTVFVVDDDNNENRGLQLHNGEKPAAE
jgi:hypothetical protein